MSERRTPDSGGTLIDETETLIRRLDVLERLCESPMHVRDLVEETGQSRATINRASNELEAVGLLVRGDDGLEATTAGRLARDRLNTFLSEFEDILTAETVLDSLPSEADITSEFVAGCEAILAAEPAPYRPVERIYDDLTETTHYRALLPALEDSRHVRLLYEHVVTEGNPAELVVTPEVFETLREEFPRQLAVLATEERFSVLVGSLPPFGLGLLGGESGVDPALGGESGVDPTARATTVHVAVLNDSGGVHGVLVNDSTAAVEWAEDRYTTARSEATDRTGDLLPDTDERERSEESYRGGSKTGRSLPASLEREGFVEVDVPYFRDAPVADPATAWRAGFSLAEVHTGYTIPRPTAGVGPDGFPGDDVDFASAITDELAAGGACVVVGPPGSGKSTVCKAVACEWYDDDRGPVLYRERERGRTVTSVDDLVSAVTAADGHALVVVEDAVRPDANRIFDAIERLGDRDDVSFLLDSRETEWRDYSDRSGDVADLRVLHVPSVSETGCERLVEHFERTTGKTVDVSANRLWSAVRDETAASDEAGMNEMLRLIHRLSTSADPLADGPTALEESIAEVYDAVADDGLALSVCILANTLNTSGVGVDPGLLYAVAAADHHDEDARAGLDSPLEAVDNALARLEGTVLFPQEDGRYRTVHEAWSTTFLEHAVDADEEAASRRFVAVVSALLALADDPDRCDRIVTHLDDVGALSDVGDDPRTWADEVAESVYVMGRKRSKLAPLFGDGANDAIELPAACSDAVVEERPVWLGRLFLAGGYYDRAERAFERLPPEDPDRGAERLLGLARIAIERGEYDEAIDCSRACLSLVESEDRPVIRARARIRIGEVMLERGEYADAETHYEAALDEFRAGGVRGREASALNRIGQVAMERGEFERAREHYESSLEIRRELGDRRGQAETLNFMGNVAWNQSAYDRAAELFERSLEIRRELGDRSGVAESFNNLGVIAGQRDEYERAAELYERSLEIRRELGDLSGVAKTLHNLGLLESLQDNFDRASELYERSLEIKREIGDRPRIAETLNNLGLVEGKRGNYDRSAEMHERCLEIRREMGNRPGITASLHNLATVESRRGAFDRATELYEQSLVIREELGDRFGLANGHCSLGELAEWQGEHGRAREHCDRALEIATEIDDSGLIAESHLRLGEIALREREHERAREHFDDAFDAVEGADMDALRIRLAHSRLALAENDLDRARSIASDAREGFAEIGAMYWVARCETHLGRIAAEAGEEETAREQFLDALDTFEEIGALHDALTTLSLLVEIASGNETADQWHERARDLLADAPEEVVEPNREWIADDR